MLKGYIKKSLILPVAAVTALGGASFAIASSGSGSGTAASPSRADAYLAATSQELKGAGYSVDQIRRELVLDGHEVYAVEGTNVRCILVAGTDQADGKSQSLGCQPSDETKPLGSGFAGSQGTVDLVWTGRSVTGLGARADGQNLTIQAGPTVVAVTRPDANASGTVTWKSVAGAAVSFDLVSAKELDVRRRAALASASTGS